MSRPGGYVGRFAPSPTGPLHAGSLVAALGSWLDARAAGGRWLVRIEDVDTPRCVPGADQHILAQLSACQLLPDGEILYQSRRGAHYEAALDRLRALGLVYPCACSRKDIELALGAAGWVGARHAELIYPRTCRHGLNGRPVRAWRMLTGDAPGQPGDLIIRWTDRRLGVQSQNVTREVGDFVIRRADGLWAYQLAVVVDDAAQGVTQVVRGEDLADNTARQIWLQRSLDLPTPGYLHLPLVRAANGEKLSKQNGAQPLALESPIRALAEAARTLGLSKPPDAASPAEALAAWVPQWAARHPVAG